MGGAGLNATHKVDAQCMEISIWWLFGSPSAVSSTRRSQERSQFAKAARDISVGWVRLWLSRMNTTSTCSGCNDDTQNMDYRVQLEVFSGPLDLLLYLVRRHEVEIVDLPIAKITAQFLEFLEVIEIIDLDQVGDFVVMASSLVEIKSRMVLP